MHGAYYGEGKSCVTVRRTVYIMSKIEPHIDQIIVGFEQLFEADDAIAFSSETCYLL